MKRIFIKTIILGLVLAGTAACGDDLEKADYNREGFSGKDLPVVSTGTVLENLGEEVTIRYSVQTGAAAVSQTGVIVGIGETPELADPQNIRAVAVLDEAGNGKANVAGLEMGKTYTARSYAFTANGIAYSEPFTFTTNVMERRTDVELDFADPTVFTDFDVVALNGVNAPSVQSFGALQMPTYGIVSSIFDNDLLFSTLSGQYIGDTDNLIVYNADFTGKRGVKVSFTLLRLSALFGKSQTSPFEVYVSEEPVATAEDLAAATKIGEGKLVAEDQFKDFEFSIPASFGKPCSVVLRIQSDQDNFGIAMMGLSSSSVYPMEESAE